VLRTLRASPRIGEILVSIDEPHLLEELPGLAGMLEAEDFRVTASKGSPSLSVASGLRELRRGGAAALVTTADHALLSTEMVGYFLDAADEAAADVAIALVSASLLQSRFPESKRTYLRLRGESYSGANLFRFRIPEGLPAVEFWVDVEDHRKSPLRLVRQFGLTTLALFALRRLDLRAAMKRASRVIGVEVAAVEMPFAEAAIDVDKLSDLEQVRQILDDANSG
jgi:hypothetical protein